MFLALQCNQGTSPLGASPLIHRLAGLFKLKMLELRANSSMSIVLRTVQFQFGLVGTP